MRARYPDREGSIERHGVKVHYELFGSGRPDVLFMPSWSIGHSHDWKAQVPYFAHHFRVLTFDGRGNGLSDRPSSAEAYADEEFVADALGVMDACGSERAVVVGASSGAWWGAILAAEHPERVLGLAILGPSSPLEDDPPEQSVYSFDEELDTDEGWAKHNRYYWLRDYRGYLEFFFAQIFPEPHSTKQIEDGVRWGLQTTPEVLIATWEAYVAGLKGPHSRAKAQEIYSKVACPTLVIGGGEDVIEGRARAIAVTEALKAELVTIEGAGHSPNAREPVKVNLLLRDFVESVSAPRGDPRSWPRARSRRKRALYIPSPIGLGHAQRDVAIADELRRLHPDLQVDWLAQHPVTEVLRARGERIHPASERLANECRHWEGESGEHDLHAFQAWRRLDEIGVANFMLFHDVVRDDQYDLWIGDEAWEVDYYLHENPEQKRAAYVWLTDFVGFLPMPDGGDREARLTADYNAEMIEQIARFPRVRDRAIFIGNPEDIVLQRFGQDLPMIAEWTAQHFDFAGYVTGFDPAAFSDRDGIRGSLGYGPDDKICIVTVGGSGVGLHLLRRIMGAFPEAKRRIPQLRMIVVAGPRVDPAALPEIRGLEVRRYVHELYRHLAVCDLAMVQGGLTTTMELTANKKPFTYFPLRHHFEQNFHVRHRLNRYRAGRCMDFDEATPETLATAIQQELARTVAYREVETGGAARAASLIAELL